MQYLQKSQEQYQITLFHAFGLNDQGLAVKEFTIDDVDIEWQDR